MEISSASANVGQLLSATKLQQQKDVAVLKMANDQMKQDGENAIRLIQSVPGATLGTKIDAFA